MSPQTSALSVGANNTPTFLADATSSLEKMESYANLLIKSGLVPKHFYELDQYRNPLKDAQGQFRGNTAAVIMTIQHGLELGMSMTQALQQIVPVNGLMSVKGDAAKALIMRSGLCRKWEETEIGEQGKDNFGIRIHSERNDGQTMIRTFTVQDAKRAGLWIDDAAVAKNEKLRHSPWYKYQSRMLRYRALGFMARDLYGDVLQNMYTEDEARDIQEDNTVMTTSDGMTVRIAEDKSAAMNESAAQALKEKPTKKKPTQAEVKKEEAKPKEAPFEDAEIVTDTITVESESVETYHEDPLYTKADLDSMDTKDVFEICKGILAFDVEKLFEGANKVKRQVGWLKRIILSNQDGSLEKLVATEFKLNIQELSGKATPADSKPEPEEEQYPIPEIGEDGKRPFEAILDLDKLAKSRKVTKDMVMSYIQEKGLSYSTNEGFYAEADADHIRAALGV